MTQLTDKHWAVEVPDDSTSHSVLSSFQPNTLSYEYSIEKAERCETGLTAMINLPPGNWQYLFTSKSASEEDAKKVVKLSEWYFPARHIRYVDYAHPYDTENKQSWNIGFTTALDSFRSLLRSNGLDENNNFSILLKR